MMKDQQLNNSRNDKSINLSVNNTVVKSKSDGQNITSFRVERFELNDSERLKLLFQQNVHSINMWNNPNTYDRKQNYTGHCKTNNYQGVFGVALDYDDGTLTLKQAREEFKDFIHIIYTSSSHQLDKPDKNGVVDRFRVILPFKPQDDCEPYYRTINESKGLYSFLKWKFPQADSSVFECGRKLFPFAAQDRSVYECHINLDGEYYFVNPADISDGIQKAREEKIHYRAKEHIDLKEEKKRQERIRNLVNQDEAKSKHTKINRTTGEAYYSPSGYEYIMPDQEIILAEDKSKIKFQDLKEEMGEKIVCYCGYCDDLNSQSASAWISKDLHGSFVMTCSHCQSEFNKNEGSQYRYYEYPVSGAMFSVNKKVYEIRTRGSSIAPVEIDSADYRNEDEWNYAQTYIRKTKFFVPDGFTINYLSNPDMNDVKPRYDLAFKNNAIEVQYPMTTVDIEDNEYVNNYHKSVFGEYSDFIQDWEALYTYTNYETLPVLVIISDRGMGKNTFVEMIAKIFPNLWSSWNGDKESFNDYYTKKLLWIDENSFGNKQSQYNEIKFITGNEWVRINEKYRPAYRVRNNANIIVTTNDTRPLAVKASETPENEMDNNFFFYKLPKISSDNRNRNLKHELAKRLGHYCRTELKERYERIMANLDQSCRYVIPCPITDLGHELYNTGRTDLEMATDDLAEAVVRGINVTNWRGDDISQYGGGTHIKFTEIGRIIKALGLMQNKYTNKHFITVLQKDKVIGTVDEREGQGKIGYKILVSKTNYPAGVMETNM